MKNKKHGNGVRLFVINENSEIKDVTRNEKGRPNHDVVNKYRKLDEWFFNKYFNHGNVLGHSLGWCTNQTNKKRDRKVFTEEGRSLNKHLARGAYFGGSIIKDYLQQRKIGKRAPENKPWGYFLIPLMYIYDREPIIEHVMKSNYAYFYTENVPSYEHPDINDRVYEVRYNHRKYLPPPKYIIIGSMCTGTKKEDRIDILKDYIPQIKTFFPNVIVVHIPHLYISNGNKGKKTGNTQTPFNILRVLEIMHNLEEGNYDNCEVKIPNNTFVAIKKVAGILAVVATVFFML